MNDRKIVAIHQPNFFPWLGYFNKIHTAESFIILDDVQLPKKGGTWSNRVKMLVSDKAKWVSAPIDRNYSGTIDINEASFIDDDWRRKILRTIEVNYSNSNFFGEIFSFINDLINYSNNNISEFNASAIFDICEAISIDIGKIHFSSKLNKDGKSNHLLVSLVKSLNGTSYLCGGGAEGYQDDKFFTDNNINIIYQNFQHPKYIQNSPNDFIPGLSIIDALMNLGFEGTSKIIK